MSLWLVRHARPLIAPGTCYGAQDMDADAAHTATAAQALALALPSACTVRTSPLKRCLQLAQSLQALRPELAFSVDARLREMDFGTWEGTPWLDVPLAAMDAWTQDFGMHRFGGKESANEVMQRVAAAWDDALDLQEQAQSAGHAHKHVLWITHSGVAQAATLLARGIRDVKEAKEWPSLGLKYGEWLTF